MDSLQHTRSQVTALLIRDDIKDHDKQNQLLNLIYVELRRMAQNKMRIERANHTLTPTALVHEAYLRLVNQPNLNWESKRHFFSAVAESMRRILIESARAKACIKRGANASHTDQIHVIVDDSLGDEMIALDRALSQLEKKDSMMADVVKLRYFSGLNVKETAMALDTSSRTIDRLWAAARAWLIIQIQ